MVERTRVDGERGRRVVLEARSAVLTTVAAGVPGEVVLTPTIVAISRKRVVDTWFRRADDDRTAISRRRDRVAKPELRKSSGDEEERSRRVSYDREERSTSEYVRVGPALPFTLRDQQGDREEVVTPKATDHPGVRCIYSFVVDETHHRRKHSGVSRVVCAK